MGMVRYYVTMDGSNVSSICYFFFVYKVFLLTYHSFNHSFYWKLQVSDCIYTLYCIYSSTPEEPLQCPWVGYVK